MRILGIDPGTIITGFGVIELPRGGKGSYKLIEFGAISAGRSGEMPKRLAAIFTGLQEIIERTEPTEFAIETAFYDKSAQSAMKLGGARGVALVAAELAGLVIAEYAPRVIKKAITGNGNAAKSQVEFMVRRMLSLDEKEKKIADAYDGLAIALTHALRRSSGAAKATSWKDYIEKNPERVRK